MSNVAVIIPGAGSGQRFGGPRNKLFEVIGDKPIFLETLGAFASRADVCQVVFVHSAEDANLLESNFGEQLDEMGITLVEGGTTRTQSVRNALAAVSEQADLIAVHDAARPCVPQNCIDEVFAKAEQTGAALLSLPIHGTVKRVDSTGLVKETLPRDAFHNLWEAQTPQVFQRAILQEAYAGHAEATDDTALVEQLGHCVHVVPGDPRNIKITTPLDLAFAEAVLPTLL